MGKLLRRISERFKEKAGAPSLTSNKRNVAMLRELSSYHSQLKSYEKDLRALKQAAEAVLKSTRETMVFPLPRIYADDAAAGAVSTGPRAPAPAMGPGTTVGGGQVSCEAISALSLDAGGKLSEEVFTPITRWQTTYAYLVAQNKELQNLRLEVDSRHRTVNELGAKVEALKSKASAEGAGGKAQAQLDQTTLKLQHKQAKLKVAQDRYWEQEEDLHRQLCTLAQNAIWLRNYACSALLIEGESLRKAGEEVGTVPAEQAATVLQPVMGAPTAAVAAAALAGEQDGRASYEAAHKPLPLAATGLPTSTRGAMAGPAAAAVGGTAAAGAAYAAGGKGTQSVNMASPGHAPHAAHAVAESPEAARTAELRAAARTPLAVGASAAGMGALGRSASRAELQRSQQQQPQYHHRHGNPFEEPESLPSPSGRGGNPFEDHPSPASPPYAQRPQQQQQQQQQQRATDYAAFAPVTPLLAAPAHGASGTVVVHPFPATAAAHGPSDTMVIHQAAAPVSRQSPPSAARAMPPAAREPERRRWEAEPRRVQGAWVEWGEGDEVVEVDLGQAPMGPPMRPQQSRQQQQQAPREPALPRVAEYHDAELEALPAPPRHLPEGRQRRQNEEVRMPAPPVESAWTL